MYACIYEIRGGFFSVVCAPNDATDHSYDPPPSATQRNRSPTGRTPARRGSHATLPWTALQLRVEVNHYPSGTRAPLAGHPRTALHVVDTSLQASHAGALLVGTCSLGGHDHAKSSSTSWSKRSSTLGLIRPLLLVAHSR